MTPEDAHPLDRFVEQYWRDRDAGGVRPLAEYLEMFPGDDDGIAAEYLDLQQAEMRDERQRIGPYRLIKELGRGGQATVWLAEDTRVRGRKVAMKLLADRAVIPDLRERFRREAEATSRLNHPGICALHEADLEAATPWIAMQFIEGRTLAQLLHDVQQDETTTMELLLLDTTVSVDAAEQATEVAATSVRGPSDREDRDRLLGLVESVARALHAAHAVGVVHRDVKPGNIMVTAAGKPIVLDFGLARLEASEGPALTQVGDAFGTPQYMAPEQVEGRVADIGAHTDVWALGITLYECLTGTRPFDRATRAAMQNAIVDEAPLNPRRLNEAVPRDLVVVLETALAKLPGDRYRTAEDFAEDLRRVRSREPILARPASTWLRLRRWAQRRPALAASLATVGLLLITGLILSYLTVRTLEESRLLTDEVVLPGLLSQRESLWPRRSRLVRDMDAWIERAEELLARRGDHRKRLADLESRGRVVREKSEPEVKFQRATDAWRHRQIRGLLDGMDQLTGDIAEMKARRQFARSIEEFSTVENRPAWDECIADVQATDFYGGLKLTPQVGLVPLGRDRDSGLWEFWHVGSGERPRWQGEVLEGRARMDAGSGIVLVLIPPGSFTMGAQAKNEQDPNYDKDSAKRPLESPPNPVELEAFFLSKFEMTQGQWERIAGLNPSFHGPGGRDAVDGRYPVENVSWNDCHRILRRLDLVLPTEAQWEYACRAGTDTPWFSGSDPAELSAVANIKDVSYARRFGKRAGSVSESVDDRHAYPAAVGLFEANDFGLHDMHGNVWEWCRDRRSPYTRPARAGDGLRSDPDDKFVMARGGGYSHLASFARSASRLGNTEDAKGDQTGVRPAAPLR